MGGFRSKLNMSFWGNLDVSQILGSQASIPIESSTVYGCVSKPIIINVSGVNTHLPAILMFDPKPYTVDDFHVHRCG